MKKITMIIFTLVLVTMLFGMDAAPRTRNRIQGQVRPSIKDIETQLPYRPGDRQWILFVEDPGDTVPPSPDQIWSAVLDSILGVGNYAWFGPTTDAAQNGPTLAEMQEYNLVIWNTFYIYLDMALTATDQANIQDYISGGGRFWLISQDALYSGVPLTFFQTNFNLESVVQDYSVVLTMNIQGLDEIAGSSFSVTADFYTFFPDALTPNANAHYIVLDPDNDAYPCILSNDSTTSFWTADGRAPGSWTDWQQMVHDMLAVFGSLSFNDVSTMSIDISSPLPWDTTLSPQATVKNLGSETETFDITCEIDPGAYSSTETVTGLAPDDSVQVTFSPDFTFATGSYTVTVYTQLEGDYNPVNDTLEKVIDTYDPGVAEENANKPETFSFIAPTISKSKAHIELTIPTATKVDLMVYDATGRLSKTVVSQKFTAGTHSLNVNLDIPTGVYFYKLKTASGENIVQKFLIIE